MKTRASLEYFVSDCRCSEKFQKVHKKDYQKPKHYNNKIIASHFLSTKKMFRLLGILFVIKLYAHTDIFNHKKKRSMSSNCFTK